MPDKPLWCIGSESRLVRVLMNLIANAADAIDGKGDIVVKAYARHIEPALAGYETIPAGDYVCLEVTDTGCGMTRETVNRIFEPFFTTKRATDHCGSGLGLSVVHGLVKDHNGYLDVTSKPGAGTTFTIYLPSAPDAAGDAVDSAAPAEKGTESILVVDDEVSQLRSVRMVLVRQGYKVQTASNGRDAVRLFEEAIHFGKKTPFDLVILDMIMPDMDGLTTFKKITAMYPGQKVLVASGHAPEEMGAELIKRGAGWLPKPYEGKDLLRVVRARLDRK